MASTSISSAEAFEIFEISSTITLEELKARYRDLARQNHPDKVDISRKEAANARMAQINNAYEILLSRVFEGQLRVPKPDFKPMSKSTESNNPFTSHNASREGCRPGSPWPQPEAGSRTWYSWPPPKPGSQYRHDVPYDADDEGSSGPNKSKPHFQSTSSKAGHDKDFQPGEPQDGYERARLLKNLENVRAEIASAYIDIKGIRDTRRDSIALPAIEIEPCAQLLNRFLEVLLRERANVDTTLEEWRKNLYQEEGFEKVYEDENGRLRIFHASAAWMNNVMLKKLRALVSWVRRINGMWVEVKAKQGVDSDMIEWWTWLAKLREHYEGLLQGWEWEEELLTTNYDVE